MNEHTDFSAEKSGAEKSGAEKSGAPANDPFKLIIGVVCLFLGGLLLADTVFRLNFFSMHNFWPLFILVPGLCFEAAFFAKRDAPGLLVPGGILTVIGLLFFFEVFTGWRFSASTWPVYLLAVMVGLYQLYLYTGRPQPLLVVITVLGAVAGVSFACILMGSFFRFLEANRLLLPLVLFGIGVILIARGFKPKK